jgi:hypothetical protein
MDTSCSMYIGSLMVRLGDVCIGSVMVRLVRICIGSIMVRLRASVQAVLWIYLVACI